MSNKSISLRELGYEAIEGKDGIDIWDIKSNKVSFHLSEEDLFQHSSSEKIYQLVINKINGK